MAAAPWAGRPTRFLCQVIRAIDGPLALFRCASVTADRGCGDCVDEETCEIRKVLLAARDATGSVLESRMIGDVVKSAHALARQAWRVRGCSSHMEPSTLRAGGGFSI
jgi:DNA-binding IscR family transcriptional regulator